MNLPASFGPDSRIGFIGLGVMGSGMAGTPEPS
jgi:hypothetical protein